MITNEEILDEYGYVTVPKNTLLFRGTNDLRSRGDYKFFATTTMYAKSFGSIVQVWKVKKQFIVPFLIKHLTHQSKGKSAIPDLYNRIFPSDANPTYRELDIKMNTKREIFIQALRDRGCVGWFSTFEDNVPCEICAFGAEMYCELIDSCDITELKLYESLKKMRIQPSQAFFQATDLCLNEYYKTHYTKKEPYHIFRSKMRNWVLDYVRNGGEEKDGKHTYYNLRLKLKV
jgi:hypothetical protein